jgi:hypothetical protein
MSEIWKRPPPMSKTLMAGPQAPWGGPDSAHGPKVCCDLSWQPPWEEMPEILEHPPHVSKTLMADPLEVMPEIRERPSPMLKTSMVGP